MRKAVIAVMVIFTALVGVLMGETSGPRGDLDYELLKASFEGDTSLVAELLKRGASVNSACGALTPLIAASVRGHVGVVELLLSKGAEVDKRTEKGPTALMQASLGGHRRVVELLLERGAKVNVKATFVWTDLTLNGETCRDSKKYGAVRALCEEADCCMTALCVASDTKVRQILIEHGGTE